MASLHVTIAAPKLLTAVAPRNRRDVQITFGGSSTAMLTG
jgi:hypothetical protein